MAGGTTLWITLFKNPEKRDSFGVCGQQIGSLSYPRRLIVSERFPKGFLVCSCSFFWCWLVQPSSTVSTLSSSPFAQKEKTIFWKCEFECCVVWILRFKRHTHKGENQRPVDFVQVVFIDREKNPCVDFYPRSFSKSK